MGTTNHGNQDITYNYYEEASAENFNKRNLEIMPRGVYQGGHLKKVTNSEVTLSLFTVEIGDDNDQISSKSTTTAILNSGTLDSGNISSATPYLVFRWSHADQANNYVEVHAIANVSAAQSNDIIIGKCEFSGVTLTGFDYSDRTLLNIQNLFLRVEATEDTEMYVWVRGGRVHTSSQKVNVAEQKVGPFTVPSSPNSRIDLVYVDTDGTLKIEQGIQEVSPSVPDYKGKLVLAEVRLVYGDSNISADRITDVRSPLTSLGSGGISSGGAYIKVSDQVASGSAAQANQSNAWTTKRINTKNHDSGNHCSISSNQITLASGTYRCRITSPVWNNCLQHKARLRNISSGTTTLVGTSESQHDNYSRGTQRSEIVGQFTILSSTIFEIQHYKKGGSGWGYPATVGEVEVYTVAEFWKVA